MQEANTNQQQQQWQQWMQKKTMTREEEPTPMLVTRSEQRDIAGGAIAISRVAGL